MPQNDGRLYWRILFWVSIGFFALCLLLIYVLNVKLGIFDKFMCGIALAIGVFAFQYLQTGSSLEDMSGDLMSGLYTLQKQHEVMRDLIESKCGGEKTGGT